MSRKIPKRSIWGFLILPFHGRWQPWNTAAPWASCFALLRAALPGIFPGAVLGVANHMNLSMEQKIKAMFVTAVIGIVMSKDCNYSAELYGCQVEPGAASGMAAGGLVYLMDGSPAQSCQAASCAVQNILGTICDPVAGLVQIPVSIETPCQQLMPLYPQTWSWGIRPIDSIGSDCRNTVSRGAPASQRAALYLPRRTLHHSSRETVSSRAKRTR